MPYALIIFLFIKLMIYLSKKENVAIETENERKEKKILKISESIQYISNGKRIDFSHGRYYFHMLNLDMFTNINAESIEIAAEERRSFVNKIFEEDTLLSSRDVAAAKYYLLDQWTYITSVN